MTSDAPCQVMPPLAADEYAAFEASIREHGVLENETIIDGHKHAEIAGRLGVWRGVARRGRAQRQLIGRNKVMTVARATAATVMSVGLAVGATSTAWAAPTMSGTYIVTFTNPTNGQSTTGNWYFTPNCGDGCVNVSGGAIGKAQLVNGQWTLDNPSIPAQCPDGTTHPDALSSHTTWDPNTLAGTVQHTTKVPVCGLPAGNQQTNNIQLRQVDQGRSPSP